MKIKQFNLGASFGGIRLQAANALVYVTIVNTFMIGAAAIRTIQEWLPWVTFPMLVGFEAIVYAAAIIFEHVFTYKAVVSYNTGQAYIKENPVVKDLELLKDNQSKIMRHLGIEDD